MNLSIIIVNYKTPELTLRCIKSIFDTVESIDFEIIVVDNNSQDNSKEIIKNNFSEIIWINNFKNEGFGRANNIGIKRAKGCYILLLNSDIIVLQNTIEKSFHYITQNKKNGVLGCQLINEDGSIQKSTYFYIAEYKGLLEKNLFYSYLIKNKHSVRGIMGAFMLIPKRVLQEVGLFDPDFFMYSEEMELCYRIAAKGYRIIYFDKEKVIHIHGASSDNKILAIRQNYLSNALLFLKVRGYWGYFLYHFIFILNNLFNFIGMWFVNKNYRKNYWQEQKNYFSNFVYYIKIPIFFTRKQGNGTRQLRRN